jgi:photosystem II stability/assembly factor-like uncharacterized protein
MKKNLPAIPLLWLLTGLLAGAAPAHDLYLFGAVNITGRVVGSRDVAKNGIYVRTAEGGFAHRGINYPAMLTGSFDPRDTRVFHVAALCGVMTTTDGGHSWRIGTGWDMTEPKSVMVDPNAPDTVYAALPDGLGVSTDRGHSWQRREEGLPARGKYTQVVTVDRTATGRVFAGCETGIYLTEDGAQNWRQVFVTVDTVTDIRQSPHDALHWLATTQSAGVLMSRDGGRSWQKLAGLTADHTYYNVAFDPTQVNRIAISSWSRGLFTSEDGGATWTARNAGLPATHRVWRTMVDPDTGRLYAAVDGEALFGSEDFGRTWRRDGMETSRIQSFVFVPRVQP